MIVRSLCFALTACAALLVSCGGRKPFQPPPPVYMQWKKVGSSMLDVKKHMLECGYPTPFGEYADGKVKVNIDIGDVILMHKCMHKFGYRYDDGVSRDYDICRKGRASEPECQGTITIPAPSVQKRLNSPYCKEYPQAEACR